MKSFDTKKKLLTEKPYKINEMTITTSKFLKSYDEPKKINIEWIRNLKECLINEQKTIQPLTLEKKKLVKIDLRKNIGLETQNFLKPDAKEYCHCLRNSANYRQNQKFFASIQNNFGQKKDFLFVFPEKIHLKK